MTALEFLFDVDLSIPAPQPPEPPPAGAEYLVAGGDGSDIVCYSVGSDTLVEVDRVTAPDPRNQILALHFIDDTLWFVDAKTSAPRDNYLSSVPFSGGRFGSISEHVITGTSSTANYWLASSGKVLAVLNGSRETLYRFDVSSGVPVETHSISTAGDARFVTFCGASDQYIAYTTGNGGTLELVDASDLTSLDSYAGRGAGLAAHRGTDVIFATSSDAAVEALSVSGGEITLLANGPTAGSGNLLWLPQRGELWSGEFFAPWDGIVWGARSSTGIGPNVMMASGYAEQRIGVVWPANNGSVTLYRADTPGAAADTVTAVFAGVGRAVAITGGSAASALTAADLAPPVLDDITPAEGTEAGGTLVGIRGARFREGARVFFGGAEAAAVAVLSQIKINATSPAGTAGAVDVIVRNPDDQEAALVDAFEYTAAPVELAVTSIDPATGAEAGGTEVTITGTAFESGATVTIGGSAATSVVVVNSTTITCTSPAGTAGDVDVVVTNPGTESATLVDGFKYTLASGGDWTPAVISGAIWFDVTETSARTVSGSALTQLVDVNGSGREFNAASGVALVSDATVGDAAEFSGTRMVGSFNNSTSVGASGSDYYTWVVARPENASNTSSVWQNVAICGDNQAGWQNIMVRDTGSGPEVLAYHWTGSALVAAAPISLSQWGLFSQEYSAGSLRLRINGGAEVATAGGAQTSGSNADLGSGATKFQGRVVMRGYLPDAPSESDRQKLEGWAMHKLGLQSLLPAGHPYKDSPP